MTIRDLQHYMYCPRRLALIRSGEWRDNFFTVRAELAHQNVHGGVHAYSSSTKKVFSNVSVYNDEYDIHGVLDCLEFVKAKKDDGGVFVPSLDGTYTLNIVEYKPTVPKNGFSDEDAIQMYAQKLCVDSIWNCDSECYIFYTNVHRRQKMPFDEPENRKRFDELFHAALNGVRAVECGEIPIAEKSAKCNGCSFRDECLPQPPSAGFIDMLRGGA